MPSDNGNAPHEHPETRRERRSHRADVPATRALPRPMRYALGVCALVAVLVGSLSFANAARTGAGAAGQDVTADLDDGTARTDVWAQVSRGDGFRPPLELEAGEAVDFTVTVDGQTVDLATTSTTVLADALIDAGIVVDLDDVVSAPMGEPPADGAEIAVERVGTQIETEVESLPFDTIEQKTSSLPSGTTRVQTEGVEGSRVITYRTTYADGEVVDQVEITTTVASQPVDEVVLVGTGSTSSGGSSGGGGGGGSAPQPVTYSGGDPRAIAQEMLSSYGWGSDQWGCLDSLWERESHWNPYAQNSSSGAYGIPQALPGSKMQSAGSDWRTNPATQIKWGLSYIQGRYGSPCGAWGHSQSHGWY